MIDSWLVDNFTKSVTCYRLHFWHACLNLLLSELSIAQHSYFVKNHDWIPAMYFFHVWVLYHIYLDAFIWLLVVYRRPVPYLFCLSFPNRASDSGDLYIDFDRNQLIFPAALLVFQVEARFNFSFPKHAYASHITSRISCHVLHHVACALHVVDCVSLFLFSCFG